MTLDTYADLFDDDLNRVSDALDRARSASGATNRMTHCDPAHAVVAILTVSFGSH